MDPFKKLKQHLRELTYGDEVQTLRDKQVEREMEELDKNDAWEDVSDRVGPALEKAKDLKQFIALLCDDNEPEDN